MTPTPTPLQMTRFVDNNPDPPRKPDNELKAERRHCISIQQSEDGRRRPVTFIDPCQTPDSRIFPQQSSEILVSGLEIGAFTLKRPLVDNVEYPPAKRARENMTTTQKQSERHDLMNISTEIVQKVGMSAPETHINSCGTESITVHAAARRDDHTPYSLQPRPTVICESKEASLSLSGPTGMAIRYLWTQDTLPSTKFFSDQASGPRRPAPRYNQSSTNETTAVIVRPTIRNLCIEGAEGSPNSSPLAKTILWPSSPISCMDKINVPSDLTVAPSEMTRQSAELKDSSNPRLSCHLWQQPLTQEVDWLFRAIPLNNEADSMRRTRKTIGFLQAKELNGWERLPEHVFSERALDTSELFHLQC